MRDQSRGTGPALLKWGLRGHPEGSRAGGLRDRDHLRGHLGLGLTLHVPEQPGTQPGTQAAQKAAIPLRAPRHQVPCLGSIFPVVWGSLLLPENAVFGSKTVSPRPYCSCARGSWALTWFWNPLMTLWFLPTPEGPLSCPVSVSVQSWFSSATADHSLT